MQQDIIHEPGRCVWKHQCGMGPQGYYDCLNNTMADVVTDPDMMTLLEQTCPNLVDGPDNTTVCCDMDMVSWQI
jgi:hypothetical protein